MRDDQANDPAQIAATQARITACIGHLDEVQRLITGLSGGAEHPVQHGLSVTSAMLQGVREADRDGLEQH